MTIKNDLKIGGIAENEIIDLLNNIGFPSIKNNDKNNLKYYDVISYIPKGVTFTSEIKFDLYASKSGNLAIEIYNTKSNTPSGLSVTKADLWWHYTISTVFLCSVKSLKYFVDNNQPLKTINSGGDNNAKLLLFKIQHISSIMKVIKLDNLGQSKESILQTMGYYI